MKCGKNEEMGWGRGAKVAKKINERGWGGVESGKNEREAWERG